VRTAPATATDEGGATAAAPTTAANEEAATAAVDQTATAAGVVAAMAAEEGRDSGSRTGATKAARRQTVTAAEDRPRLQPKWGHDGGRRWPQRRQIGVDGIKT
jgi:hypothetical protein